MSQIHTRWHRALEAVAEGQIVGMSLAEMVNDGVMQFNPKTDWIHGSDVTQFIHLASTQPRFVVRPEDINSFSSQQSIELWHDLVSADAARLPYPAVLLEVYRSHSSLFHLCVHRNERGEVDHDGASISVITMGHRNDNPLMVGELYTELSVRDLPIHQETGVAALRGGSAQPRWSRPLVSRLQEKNRDLFEKWAREQGNQAVGDVVRFINLLAIRGTVQESVSLEKFDRSRVRSGRPPAGSYTLVRIGRVYSHDGKTVLTDRHLRPHVRRGHVKMQPCGPGLTERKRIFVHPYWVGLTPGTTPVVARDYVVQGSTALQS